MYIFCVKLLMLLYLFTLDEIAILYFVNCPETRMKHKISIVSKIKKKKKKIDALQQKICVCCNLLERLRD